MKHNRKKFHTNSDQFFRLTFRLRLMRVHDSRGQQIKYLHDYLVFFSGDTLDRVEDFTFSGVFSSIGDLMYFLRLGGL